MQQVLIELGELDQARQGLSRLHALSLDTTLPFVQVQALMLELRLRSGRGRDDLLVPTFERARAFGESGSEVAMKLTFKSAALLALADSMLRSGAADKALAWSERSIELLRKPEGQLPELRQMAMARMLAGIAMLQLGRAESALTGLQQAQSDFARAFGVAHFTTQFCALNVALALEALQRPEQAAEIVKRADVVLHDALGADSPAYREIQALLGRLQAASVESDAVSIGAQRSEWAYFR